MSLPYGRPIIHHAYTDPLLCSPSPLFAEKPFPDKSCLAQDCYSPLTHTSPSLLYHNSGNWEQPSLGTTLLVGCFLLCQSRSSYRFLTISADEYFPPDTCTTTDPHESASGENEDCQWDRGLLQLFRLQQSFREPSSNAQVTRVKPDPTTPPLSGCHNSANSPSRYFGIPIRAETTYLLPKDLSIPPTLENVRSSTTTNLDKDDALEGFPTSLYALAFATETDPGLTDVDSSNPSMTPRKRPVRDTANLYTPRWVRSDSRTRQGWCGLCPQGRWLSLKRSEYRYHMLYVHGVAPQGDLLPRPIETRRTRQESYWESLCGSCGRWIALNGGRKVETSWFRHVHRVGQSLTPKNMAEYADETVVPERFSGNNPLKTVLGIAL